MADILVFWFVMAAAASILVAVHGGPWIAAKIRRGSSPGSRSGPGSETPTGQGSSTTDATSPSEETDMSVGLTTAQVEQKLREVGYNEIPEKRQYPVLQFLSKFWGLTAWLLELIIVISWVLQKYSDVYVVLALLVVNAIVAFSQELRASKAVEMLRKRLQVATRVLRNGTWQDLSARELVPGDVIRVRAGDFVPADAKVLDGDLQVDQSTLTGETLPRRAVASEVLYSGSVIQRGEANALVLSTGLATSYGRTTQLVQTARPKLHVEEVISRVVRWLLLVVAVLLVALVSVSVARGERLVDMLPLALIVLLSAIPVALPVMYTVSMAVGSLQLTRKGALVTRLSASEDAASMDVLCVDKTGTLTKNRLAISRVLPRVGFAEKDVVLYGALASQAANRDPIDLAFLAMADEEKLSLEPFAVNEFSPFDPESRRTEAGITLGSESFRVTKGAPLSIAKACALTDAATAEVATQEETLSQGGQRVLAVARIERPGIARMVGLVSLRDPLRPDSKALVHELRDLGVEVKMLTGDALPVARQVTQEVDLVGEVQRASDLEHLATEDADKAAETAERSAGFAEIYPEGKYAVVRALQKRGHVVGMTGDGVNDAPALRQAEVGIAVSTAVDVAKGAASVVLTTDGLSSIVELAKTGRMIHERITTWIVNKISRTVLTSGFTVLAFLITGSYVVSAFGLILMVVVTDFGKISLSTDNVRWSERPVSWNLNGLVKLAVSLGVLMLAECLAFFFVGLSMLHLEGNIPALQTFTFEILFYFAIFSLLGVRERDHFWRSRPSWTLAVVLGIEALLSGVLATIGMPGLAALPITTTLAVVGYSFATALVLNDWVKVGLVKAFRVRAAHGE